MHTYLSFLAISFIVIATPGPDTALTVRNTLFGGRTGGVLTALGIASGQLVWAVATSLGAVAILVAAKPVLLAVRYLGAAYLIYLGAIALRTAFTARASAREDKAVRASHRLAPRVAFRQGIISYLGNPKMAVFFASLLPQFVSGGEASFASLMVLECSFAAMTFAWLTAYATLVNRAGGILRRPWVRRWTEAVTGALLVALGIRIIVAER